MKHTGHQDADQVAYPRPRGIFIHESRRVFHRASTLLWTDSAWGVPRPWASRRGDQRRHQRGPPGAAEPPAAKRVPGAKVERVAHRVAKLRAPPNARRTAAEDRLADRVDVFVADPQGDAAGRELGVTKDRADHRPHAVPVRVKALERDRGAPHGIVDRP